MSPRQVVLGVGNAIMTDDAVGIAAAGVLAGRLQDRPEVEVRISERGGLDLLDLLDGCDHAVIVDAYLVPGEEPGTVLTRCVEDFSGSHHLYAAHGIDLPTALRLGRELGGDMPSRVDIVGVVVEDPYTVSERMTPAVAAAVQPAVARVLALLDTPAR
jgi:hydrogenase maturation protease